jgi:hypothetical protein
MVRLVLGSFDFMGRDRQFFSAIRIKAMPVVDIAIPVKKKKHWEHLNKGSYKAKK